MFIRPFWTFVSTQAHKNLHESSVIKDSCPLTSLQNPSSVILDNTDQLATRSDESTQPHFVNLFRTTPVPTDNLLLLISLGHTLTGKLTESLMFISPFRTVVDPIAGAPQGDADVVAGAP